MKISEKIANDKESIERCNRLIWRLGELKATQAVPDLINAIIDPGILNNKNDQLRNYSIAWSLGRCSDPQAVTALKQLYLTKKSPDYVQRMAAHALYHVTPESERQSLLAEYRERLPQHFQKLLTEESEIRLMESLLQAQLIQPNNAKQSTHSEYIYFTQLYLFAKHHQALRNALLVLARTTPFEKKSLLVNSPVFQNCRV